MCELVERQGIDIGQNYKNDKACSMFVHYIAQDLKLQLLDSLSKVKYFSIQSDGSTYTDSGNTEEELFLIQYFDPCLGGKQVCIKNNFFAVRQPKHCTGMGLFQCLEDAIGYVGISDWKERLVGYGCNGASANKAAGDLRGHLENAVPSVVMYWCLAHRLELSLSDSLKNTYFATIDEMLLRLYYIYKKSPKKCRELEDIVRDKIC